MRLLQMRPDHQIRLHQRTRKGNRRHRSPLTAPPEGQMAPRLPARGSRGQPGSANPHRPRMSPLTLAVSPIQEAGDWREVPS